MKKLFIVISFAVLCASCSTIRPTQRVCQTVFSDYRQYTEQGFLISPNAYPNEFEAVGEVNIIVTPALIETEIQSQYTGGGTRMGVAYEIISYDELVAMAVKEAKSKGADALVNFTIDVQEIKSVDQMYGGYTTGYKYYVKGYCIKRK